MYIVLTHDVDSVRRPLKHVLQRWRRFNITDLIKHILGLTNLYNNIEEILALEDRYGVRSTFFIPVQLFPIDEIDDILKYAITQGWEVELHYVYESVQPEALLKMQKEYMEQKLSIKVLGVRVHNLIISRDILKMFSKVGILYDSTYRAESLDTYDPTHIENILEIPIAVMDTDLFGRLHMNEEYAIKYIMWKLNTAQARGHRFFTILFHQESYKMKGGRIYRELLRQLVAQGHMFLRCIDVLNMFIRGQEIKRTGEAPAGRAAGI